MRSQVVGTADVLLITALPEERRAVLAHLGDHQTVYADDGLTYYVGMVGACDGVAPIRVAVTMLNQTGNVEAASHAHSSIRAIQPECILMVGIAGGIHQRALLGDVIVADHIWYYEPAKQKPGNTQRRPAAYPSDPHLLNLAKNFEDVNWHHLIRVERPVDGISDVPNVHFGPIAVGEKVVADSTFLSKLEHLLPKLLAVETESFGIAVAAARAPNRPRFLTIRGVSDYADVTKDDAWHDYAADAAATFAFGLIRNCAICRRTSPSFAPASPVLIAIRHQSMDPIAPLAIAQSLPTQLQDAAIEEVVVDQTDLCVQGRVVDPLQAVQRQRHLNRQVMDLLTSNPNARVAYYGIAHIPLLVLAGYQLSNRYPVQFFELNLTSGTWESLSGTPTFPELVVDGLPKSVDERSGAVALRISISYPITEADVAAIVPSPVASVQVGVPIPRRDVITSERQLEAYARTCRYVLDEIHNKLPNARCVHVFFAGPISLAVTFGRLISKTIHPSIVVYSYCVKDNPRYSWGLEITRYPECTEMLVVTEALMEDDQKNVRST